jgi:hypothetical protein
VHGQHPKRCWSELFWNWEALEDHQWESPLEHQDISQPNCHILQQSFIVAVEPSPICRNWEQFCVSWTSWGFPPHPESNPGNVIVCLQVQRTIYGTTRLNTSINYENRCYTQFVGRRNAYRHRGCRAELFWNIDLKTASLHLAWLEGFAQGVGACYSTPGGTLSAASNNTLQHCCVASSDVIQQPNSPKQASTSGWCGNLLVAPWVYFTIAEALYEILRIQPIGVSIDHRYNHFIQGGGEANPGHVYSGPVDSRHSHLYWVPMGAHYRCRKY